MINSVDQLKKNLSEIEFVTQKLRTDLKPIQTDFSKFAKRHKQYINSFCRGKRNISTKELLYLLEQYELFKTTEPNRAAKNGN